MRDFLDTSDLPPDSLGHVFVDTIQTKSIFRGLDDLFASPRTATNGRGLAVLGLPRCGKTLLVQEYLRRCMKGDTRDREGEDIVRRPLRYLYVQLQPGTRLSTIPSQTLEVLGHPAPFAGRHDTTQTRDVISMIVEGAYEVVVYDEVHHLTSSDTKRVRENGTHWLTHVLDRTRCPMILIGYKRFSNILRENGFLGGRLVAAEPLKPYSLDDRQSFTMFMVVLRAFEGALGLPTASDLWRPDTAARLLAASGGRIGLLENLLTAARQEARRLRHSALTTEVLAAAVERMRNSWGDLRFNPFEVTDLKAAIKEHGEGFKLPEDEQQESSSSARAATRSSSAPG